MVVFVNIFVSHFLEEKDFRWNKDKQRDICNFSCLSIGYGRRFRVTILSYESRIFLMLVLEFAQMSAAEHFCLVPNIFYIHFTMFSHY